ncbi:hypothetical protein B0H14DRAFT_2659810 [Mycena olivaceomarginata]|nr:hypothetical protein B0H14DRAFT_2659810 [Mycena olivaceomarginata]
MQQATSTPQHTYGTRIRHNIRIKPSARLRQSPAPNSHRRTKSNPVPKPLVFPPPHVVLHPDDANSKVFLALGRSLMSVDNRAMTIKDLAEMVIFHGLVCQNVSAASQAITTYIRIHMQRCEAQQDHPLLLRHTLSGTPSDDDLLPALHSRSGGAHCGINTDNRATNFRRGTMVWYLSGATGAPCPFARAGIMLCEYGENGRTGSQLRDKKKQPDRSEECGSKRKRSLRGCAADSDSESSIEEVRPPPKVKLTLRLKPLRAFASTEPRQPELASNPEPINISDDSMSEDSSDDGDDESDDAGPQPKEEEQPFLPPYPRRSISIPCYTPSVDGPYPSFPPQTPYQRSSSVPYSVASLPPDSDDDDDYHISMTGGRRSSTGRLLTPAKFDSDWDQWDADDSEGDGETTWESPGPRSPSAAPLGEVSVKQEPRDMLDSWDDFGSDARISSAVKVESVDPWDWHSGYAPRPWDEDDLIKQEDDLDSLSSSFDNSRDPVPGPSSPLSPVASLNSFFESSRRASDPASWRDSDTPELESEWLSLDTDKPAGTIRPRAKTVPSLSSFFSAPTPFASAAPPLVVKPDPPALVTQSLASLIQAMSMNSPTSTVPPFSLHPPACISPQETRCNGWSSDMVVVHTCLPCTPSISATQVEGISVYQMTLRTQTLLRRLDTDFVNLSPIVAFSNTPYPVLSTIPNATVISRGSAAVKGTWVPLAAAQAYVRDHPLPDGVLDLGQFGAHFGSTLQATQLCSGSSGSPPRREPDSIIHLHKISNEDGEATEPLSSTEQQMFRELCVTTDWDKDSPATATQCDFEPPPLSPLSDCPPDAEEPERERERSGRPLRRSKRVADAMIKAQSRTRSRPRRRN